MLGKSLSEQGEFDSIKVDLHCHSYLSDGILTPEQIAKNLSDAGVKYASLTDHNTISGLSSFRRALARFGIGFITGLEITTVHKNTVIHLLAYGFDPDYPGLVSMLNEKYNGSNSEVSANVMLKVFRSAAEIIKLVHEAGGVAVLAHPFHTVSDPDALGFLMNELQNLGLDGIEALYGPYSQENRAKLILMAQKRNLTVSAGTDYHSGEEDAPGIEIKLSCWKSFRDSILKNSGRAGRDADSPGPQIPDKPENRWFSFVSNICLPAFLSLALLLFGLFAVLLPYFENTLMERKRENIRQLTQVAWGVLNEAAEEVEGGHLSMEQAQALAKNRIEAMRYGSENKDYFWLQDVSPRILMHPYRKDLNDQDVSDFRDAHGTRIFVAFADLVTERGEGYISYVWHWQDDLDRMEPKESYIRLFEPWGWIIGTGIYVYDVQAEIANLRRHIVKMSLAIISVVLLLLIYLVRQGLLLEQSKKEAQTLLLESIERYRALSEAATEGALFIYDGRCRYANTVMYELLGCGPENIELLDIEDVFPDVEANKKWLDCLSNKNDSDSSTPVSGVLRRCDGTVLSCSLSFSNDPEDPKGGLMILVRRSVDSAEHTGTHMALNRLLHLPADVVSGLADSIRNSRQISEVVSLSRKRSDIVFSLLENGTSSIAIAYMISTITDLTVQRIVELCVSEQGPAPASFAFLALGSHGRQSQTLSSDQDNALVYGKAEKGGEKEAEEYFLKLGARVCDILEKAGYRKCVGKKTAGNPQWNKPLEQWKKYFEEWIRNSDGQQVVEFSIFFDFRPVAGDAELAAELRNFINPILKQTPFFLSQAAQNALIFKTPMRLFGTIVTSGGKDHPGRIDVKSPAMAIVSFARLYALKNYLRETNTLVCLDAIKSLGVISDAKHREIVTAYEFLLRLRLRNQVLGLEHNQREDNWVDPGQLGRLEEVLLRESFKEIDELQVLIQKDFLA